MPSPKKFIIITSIFAPNVVIEKFSKLEDWQLIVVGDKKTPTDWQHEGVIYLGPEDQQALGFAVLANLPWNHYCRKMVGYLYAIKQGAEYIADTDDDNEPLEGWPQLQLPMDTQNFDTLSGQKFVNIYNYYTDKRVWPRGFPLNKLLDDTTVEPTDGTGDVAIWQFLANEDPDVDAIYRLTDNTPIYFNDGPRYMLDPGTVCPFNSQNTIFRKDVFALLYLPAFVTFRFTDILRGLVAQPVLWQNDRRLGFGPATVIQKRNPHDYLRDFESEIPVYLHSEAVIDIAVEALATHPSDSIVDQLVTVYQALYDRKIVTQEEMQLLNTWVEDCKTLGVA